MAMGSSYISDGLALLWSGAKAAIPGVKLGGIFANKSGYHNSRANHFTKEAKQKGWDDTYSVQLSMDKKGSASLASAIDLTMSNTEMRKRTKLLRDSSLDKEDERLRCLREFIGTLDSKRVFCLEGGNAGLGQGRGEEDEGRDSSHLWHIHLSILRAYAADWDALAGVLSVLSGETLAEWRKRTGAAAPVKPSKPTTPKPSKPSTKPAPGPHYAFPLPSGYYFGPKGGPAKSVSGYYGRSFKGKTDREWLKIYGEQLCKRGWPVGKGKKYLRSGIDGFFGPEYEALTKDFQADQGIRVDGKPGPQTWRAAFENPVG